MAGMVPPLKIVEDEDSVDLRAHYGMLAQHALRLLWQRKWLVAATVVAGLVTAVVALTQMKPRYTSEALLQVNLGPDTGTKNQPTVTVNGVEVVNSIARVIGSRATADAVVTRLGLDGDPGFEPQPRLSRWLLAVRSALGLQQTAMTPRDIAIDALLRQVRVTAEPRSYLISVAVTAGDPEFAAKLANAVAVEYWWRQTLKELAEERSAVDHDLTEASLVYGSRHPTYLRASTKLQQLDVRVARLRDASSTEDLIKLATEHSLIAADKVMKPSGPNIPAILALAILAGLSLGICLARYTPIGFVRRALTASVQIPPLVACAVMSAGWGARSALLVLRRRRPLMGFALSAGSWRRTAWRPLLGILFCLAIAGLGTVNGDAISSLVHSVVQSIPVFRMPSFGAWVGRARDHLFANLPAAAHSEPRLEDAIPSAASSAAETHAIFPAAEPVSLPRPVQVQPSAPAPAPQVPEPEPIAPTPAVSPATEPTPAVPPATEPTLVVPPADRRLSGADSAALVARGDAFVRARDVASARLFYERAAEMGDGRGALQMGATFDPAFLDRAGLRGAQGNQPEALWWYRRARDLGDTEADRLLKTLEPH